MSEETPPSWTSDISAETLGAPAMDAAGPVTDEGVAGAWVLSLSGGLLVGILAACVGGAVWFGSVVLTESMYAALAILVGFIIGLGVWFGSGRRKSLLMAGIAVGLTLITLALSEYFIVRHFAVQLLAEQGAKGDVPLFRPLAEMVDVVMESISEDPINLMFWAGACVGAFFIPARGTTARQR
jgi:hypothetical protein